MSQVNISDLAKSIAALSDEYDNNQKEIDLLMQMVHSLQLNQNAIKISMNVLMQIGSKM